MPGKRASRSDSRGILLVLLASFSVSSPAASAPLVTPLVTQAFVDYEIEAMVERNCSLGCTESAQFSGFVPISTNPIRTDELVRFTYGTSSNSVSARSDVESELFYSSILNQTTIDFRIGTGLTDSEPSAPHFAAHARSSLEASFRFSIPDPGQDWGLALFAQLRVTLDPFATYVAQYTISDVESGDVLFEAASADNLTLDITAYAGRELEAYFSGTLEAAGAAGFAGGATGLTNRSFSDFVTAYARITPIVVPEPGTLPLALAGLCALAFARARRRLR